MKQPKNRDNAEEFSEAANDFIHGSNFSHRYLKAANKTADLVIAAIIAKVNRNVSMTVADKYNDKNK